MLPVFPSGLVTLLHTPRGARECDVLVVEDDPILRRSVAQTLEDEGYRVVGARDGVDALRVLGRCSPWLILLDIWLPRMNGPEFVSELRDRGADVKIVVMTAAQHARRWATALGADAILAKPFESFELVDLVAQQRPS
ncbi:MAG TPA: response regulator [Chloroflexota bacterium]|nr:response regulator [Chloroflexota bacterium]